jgi:hypothetical protein
LIIGPCRCPFQIEAERQCATEREGGERGGEEGKRHEACVREEEERKRGEKRSVNCDKGA